MTTQSPYPYRVFLCFSHKDSNIRQIVQEHLQSLGLEVCWSGNLLAGTRFAEQIREGISRAHLFVPILTKGSSRRPWVHQEIGFALGQNIPLMPLAVGDLPSGLAEELQAISLHGEEANLKSELKTKMTRERIRQLIELTSLELRAVFDSAELQEDRTRMLFMAAQRILHSGGPVKIRQAGAFSSFSLPSPTQPDSIWKRCDGNGLPRCSALRRDLPKERYFLEQHAQAASCDLILDPSGPMSYRGNEAKKCRLEILREFLVQMTERNRVRAVIVDQSVGHEGNLLFIGDWFMAESIMPRPGYGYRQTLATWHAPTILQRLRQFDEDFQRLWQRSNPPIAPGDAVQTNSKNDDAGHEFGASGIEGADDVSQTKGKNEAVIAQLDQMIQSLE